MAQPMDALPEGEEILEMGKGSVMRSNELRLKRENWLGLQKVSGSEVN